MALGYISIHRKIKEHWIFKEERAFSRYEAWIDLLLLVNHQDNKFLHDGELVEVKRGSTITSLRKLSEYWSWSTTKTKRFLDLLQSDKMIDYKSNTKKTLLTVVNYDLWQSNDIEKKHRSNTEVTQKKQGSNTEVTQKKTNNNDKECFNNDLIMINNEKEENIVDEIRKYWNNTNLPKVIKFSKDRTTRLKTRLKEYTAEQLKQAIDNLSESSFCNGRNDRGWKANIDFLLKNENNILQILEGKFKNKDTKINDKTARDIEVGENWLKNRKKEKDAEDVE